MSSVKEMVERTRGALGDALAHLRPPYPPVAVELDPQEAVIVRLKTRPRHKPLLEAHAVRPLPEKTVPGSIFEQGGGAPAELSMRFRELFEASGTRPGRVSLVLPDNLAKISLLALPERPASQRQLDELVRSKMRRAFPFRLDEAAVSYQLLPGDGRKVVVLVALSPRTLLERLEQALRTVGARVGLIDISTPNLINLCRQRLEATSREGGDTALLNCAENYFTLIIVRDGKLIFFRCKTIPRETAPTNGPNGFLVREIANSLSYYREKLSGQGVGRVLMRTVRVPFDEVVDKLRRLELREIEPIRPTAELELPPGPGLDATLAMRLAPALGAATRRSG